MGGPSEFDAWMVATWTLRGTLLTALAAVCTTVVLAIVLGAQERDLRAFDNAPICTITTATTTTRDTGCRIEVPVTIQDRGTSGSDRDPTYYLDLTGPTSATNGRIDMPHDSAVWNAAVAGDEATAVVWNGAVVRIEDNGVDGDTSRAPGIRTVLVEGLLIGAALWIVAFGVFAARIAESRRYGAASVWTHFLIPAEPVLLPAPIFFALGALIGQESESLLMSIAIGAGFTAFAGVVTLVSWLRNR